MHWTHPLFWGLLMGSTLRPTLALAQGKVEPCAVISVGSVSSRQPISAGQAVFKDNEKPLNIGGAIFFNEGSDGDAEKNGISEASIRHNLDGLNALRAKAGVSALKLDAKLCDFARQGSLELLKTHTPHGHFKAADVWGSGFENAAAENQGDPHGWTPGPVNRAIDQILQAMMDEGPGGGHHDTILNPKYSRVGIGLVQDKAGRLYLTNDFSG